jgi:ATP diphosphatase
VKQEKDRGDISKLLDVMAALRDPASGCPWDLEQDFTSIAPYTIEEAYEVADCIERGALDELPGELGDLLLQVVFHAQMARDRGLFEFTDVVECICDKMIRRHPHVFGDAKADSGAEVVASWDAIKQQEKPSDQKHLDSVALGLPALLRAYKLGKRAATVGFDWQSTAPVRDKIDEELAELDAALDDGDRRQIEAEVGDLLFSVVNLSRHLRIDPERALRRSSDRFVSRFNAVERAVLETGGDWSAFDQDALDALWERAKDAEAQRRF